MSSSYLVLPLSSEKKKMTNGQKRLTVDLNVALKRALCVCVCVCVCVHMGRYAYGIKTKDDQTQLIFARFAGFQQRGETLLSKGLFLLICSYEN